MRSRCLALILASAALLMAACTPPAPEPAQPAAPAPQPKVAEPKAPAEAKPAQQKPAVQQQPAEKEPARPEWEEEWERTLEAARQEGVVAVAGPTGPEVREVLTAPFTDKYGIPVDFMGARGAELSPRIATERDAGQYLWDVYVAGTSTALQGLIPIGALDPLEPALILPEVEDPSNWRGGELDFADSGRTNLAMTPFQRPIIFVNPNETDPGQFTSYRDLLDPRWRGQIVIDDPRRSGPGQATFTFFYAHPELGPDFIREFAQQELTILRDYQQEVDFVAQGRYPIGVGLNDGLAEDLVRRGLPIAFVPPTQVREGSDVSPSFGSMAIFNRAPHPNAAKVYVNWLLGQEAQTAFARTTGFVSSRLDVPTDHTFDWRVPLPGSIKTYDERSLEIKDEMFPVLEEVFGPA